MILKYIDQYLDDDGTPLNIVIPKLSLDVQDLQDDFIRKEGAIFRKIKNIIREYRRQEETRVIGGGIPIQRGIDIGRENIPDVLYVPENSQVSSQVNVLQQFGRTHSYL